MHKIKTKTFVTCCGKYRVTVNEYFLRYVDVTMFDGHDLFYTHRMNDFLHSTTGPALVHLATGEKFYWINGKPASEEEAGRIRIHDRVDREIGKLLDD